MQQFVRNTNALHFVSSEFDNKNKTVFFGHETRQRDKLQATLFGELSTRTIETATVLTLTLTLTLTLNLNLTLTFTFTFTLSLSLTP